MGEEKLPLELALRAEETGVEKLHEAPQIADLVLDRVVMRRLNPVEPPFLSPNNPYRIDAWAQLGHSAPNWTV
jgi:hypothetical protein